jgi:plastocyanin
MAQNLLNRKVGDKVEFDLGDRHNVFVIKDIAKADTSLLPVGSSGDQTE